MVASIDAEVFVAAEAILGEGPTWDAEAGRLVWLDIAGRRLHETELDGTDRSFEVDQEISIAIPAGSDRYVVGVRDGFGTVAVDRSAGSARLEVTHAVTPAGLRMNDGKCSRAGRLYAGTMAFDAAQGAGTLYRLDPDGSVHELVDQLTISNGMAWSADDRRLYFIDTMTGGVDEFDHDPATGAIDGRRPLFSVDPAMGFPDGMTIDTDGNLWIAFWDGGAVRCFTPGGDLLAEIRMPCSRPTSCVFGGPSLATLFVTSARDGLSAEQLRDQPAAGSVFAARPGATGFPSPLFAGQL